MKEKSQWRRDKKIDSQDYRRHEPKIPNNFIWGRNPVLEWLESGLLIKKIILSREAGGPPVTDILKIADQKKVPVQRVHPAKLEEMVGTNKHQNIVAEVELPPYAELDDILAAATQKNEPPLIGILDGLQDPHNLGAILRSADAAGLHGIIIPKDKAVGMTPTVVKASAGAAVYVPLVVVTNIVRTMEELVKKGIWVTGSADDAEKEFSEADFSGPCAIVLGSEGSGLRRLVREKCDFLVRIPMHGHVKSLNVSVAAGLLFFEARRQRR